MPGLHMTSAPLLGWGNPVEVERRRRIRLSVWAYAYEIADDPLVSDTVFDTVARASEPDIDTGHLDDWWRIMFNPSTGLWIHSHPELDKVKQTYERITGHSTPRSL